jgi:hypothetical protein
MNPVELILKEFVLETGQSYGESIQPWQRAFFDAIFAALPDRRPRYRLVYDERRRGESKTEDMAAAAVTDLLTGPPRHRSFCVAADQDQAALILDSVRGFQSRSAVLAGLEVGRALVRNPATDSELRVMSSDDRTAYGIRPRRVFFDELSLQIDKRLWLAMWTAIGKNPRSQMIAVSMAGFDFSSIGWEVRELASKNSDYYFASREGSTLAPWLSERDMAEQEATLHPADFSRFWLCKWTETAGTWITREMYDQAERAEESRDADPAHPCYGFVDVGLVHDPTAIAVVHAVGDCVVLDTLRTIQGSRDEPVEMAYVEDLVADLTERYRVSRWVFEAPQAVASVQRLQHRLAGRSKVEARYPTAETQARLFGGLYRLFSTGKLAIYHHEQLRREALNLVVRVVGGRMRVVESTSVHQDHVVALGGACELALTIKRPVLIVAPPLLYAPSIGSIMDGSATSDDGRVVEASLLPFNQAARRPVDDVPGSVQVSAGRSGEVVLMPVPMPKSALR